MNAFTDLDAMNAAAATPAGRDHLWLELTAIANKAFSAGEHAAARTLYMWALTEAERLFALQRPEALTVPLPVIVNVSCHNLAALLVHEGKDAEATEPLARAFDLLTGTASRRSAPIALRISCTQHLKYALAELAAHIGKQGATGAEIDSHVARAKAAALSVHHAVEHLRRIAQSACGHCRLLN